jgi:protein phosphatase 1 regulatory subunit 7
MLTLQANFISEITGVSELPNLEQLYFQQNQITHISGIENNHKLEILDLALNKLTKLENLESQAESLDELWINDNKIADWSSVEYLGKTLKNLNNIYMAVNPVYNRTQEFKNKLKATVPCLTQLEGSPFDRPVYQFSNPAGVTGIFKKGINPKAKAILEDILGKQAADDYHKEQDLLDKEKDAAFEKFKEQ